MRNVIANLILALAILVCLTSCTHSTEYGACVGVLSEKDPKLQYKISWWNGFVAALLSQTVIVPVYTVANEIQCPVGKK